MPAPEERAAAEPELELPEVEFDAQIARAGIQLSATERGNVLALARSLQRSLALIRSYNAADHSIDDLA